MAVWMYVSCTCMNGISFFGQSHALLTEHWFSLGSIAMILHLLDMVYYIWMLICMIRISVMMINVFLQPAASSYFEHCDDIELNTVVKMVMIM